MRIKKNLRQQRKNNIIKTLRKMQKAIRLNCYDCMGEQKKIDCELKNCSLYNYRPWAKNNDSMKDK